jgi:hypothetical protein
MINQCDEDLRQLIKKMWPYHPDSTINLLVPSKEELHGTPQKRRLTVGKIYAGLLAVENFRSYKNYAATCGNGEAVST